MSGVVPIPARKGVALRLAAGRCVKLTNTHGSQVIDTWVFNARDMTEHLSTEHTRSCLERLVPRAGDSLYSNRRRPIAVLVEDASPCVHDLLLSACDAERYRLLGHPGYHDNCADNLRAALGALGFAAPGVPSPWNVFENVAVHADGRLEIRPPLAKAGDYVVLRAEVDAVVVFSACPMDLVPTNGADRQPRGAAYQLL